MGYDSDHALAAGEVGRVGVAIDSIEDMAELFDGIPLDRVSTSMTINATAIILLALYVAVARRQGVAPTALSGTIQNDILKEYVARGTYIYPPRRVAADRHRHLRVLRARAAELEHDLDQRLPHPRGGIDGGPGGRVHVRERDRLRRRRRSTPGSTSTASASGSRSSSTRTTTSSRRSRSSAPRGGCGRGIMRDRFGATQPARAAAALPHPDGRQHADRAAARQQHRPRRAAGAGGGARRHAVAALQRPRRGAGAADRGVGARSRSGRSRSSPPRAASPTPSTRSAARTRSRS